MLQQELNVKDIEIKSLKQAMSTQTASIVLLAG